MTIDSALVKPIIDVLVAKLMSIDGIKVKKRAASALNEVIRGLIKIRPDVTVAEAKMQIAKAAAGIISAGRIPAKKVRAPAKTKSKVASRKAAPGKPSPGKETTRKVAAKGPVVAKVMPKKAVAGRPLPKKPAAKKSIVSTAITKGPVAAKTAPKARIMKKPVVKKSATRKNPVATPTTAIQSVASPAAGTTAIVATPVVEKPSNPHS